MRVPSRQVPTVVRARVSAAASTSNQAPPPGRGPEATTVRQGPEQAIEARDDDGGRIVAAFDTEAAQLLAGGGRSDPPDIGHETGEHWLVLSKVWMRSAPTSSSEMTVIFSRSTAARRSPTAGEARSVEAGPARDEHCLVYQARRREPIRQRGPALAEDPGQTFCREHPHGRQQSEAAIGACLDAKGLDAGIDESAFTLRLGVLAADDPGLTSCSGADEPRSNGRSSRVSKTTRTGERSSSPGSRTSSSGSSASMVDTPTRNRVGMDPQ
jgi:hypothetical protein